MKITPLTSAELMAVTAASLDVTLKSPTFDVTLLAALVRRAAGACCPCSPATLVSMVLETIPLDSKASELKDRLYDIVNDLIVLGDLLELSQVTMDVADVEGPRVFLGPPSFVARPHGGLIISGLSPDEITPLPATLASRVRSEGVARLLDATPDENLPSTLRDLGFVELSAKRWLRSPSPSPAEAVVQNFASRLQLLPPSGSIPQLSILDPTTPVTHYRRRWKAPSGLSGCFVGRRPRTYGSPIWGLVDLEAGEPTRFLDFPLADYPYRGCDIAWYVQMAIDAKRGHPQRYRIRTTPEGSSIDIFSPLPLWAERRLRILGRPMPANGCLASFELPTKEVEAEEQFLRHNLWLRPSDTIT